MNMRSFVSLNLAGRVAIATTLAIGSTVALTSSALAATLRVTIDNLAPTNGTFLTPVWVGFHDGLFDIYDRDVSLDLFPGTEALVEDGNTAPLSERFANTSSGVDGTIAGPAAPARPPLAPGESTSFTFDVDPNSDQYFSYASMVIPSNDFFIANGNPLAHQIFDAAGNFIATDFIVTGAQVLDGGTEENDESTTNTAFFGQAAPNTGVDENGVVTLANGFIPDGPILSALNGGPGFNFTGADFTETGYEVARFRVELVDDGASVPEPGTILGLLTLGGSMAAFSRRRMQAG